MNLPHTPWDEAEHRRASAPNTSALLCESSRDQVVSVGTSLSSDWGVCSSEVRTLAQLLKAAWTGRAGYFPGRWLTRSKKLAEAAKAYAAALDAVVDAKNAAKRAQENLELAALAAFSGDPATKREYHAMKAPPRMAPAPPGSPVF